MPVADAEHVRSYAIGGARAREVVHGHVEVWLNGIVEAEPFEDAALVEDVEHAAVLDLFECLRVGYHLDEAAFVARLQAAECHHAQVEIVQYPQMVHHVYELNYELVLAQIVAYFVDCEETARRRVQILEAQLQRHCERVYVCAILKVLFNC